MVRRWTREPTSGPSAVVLFEMLSGRPVFARDTLADTLAWSCSSASPSGRFCLHDPAGARSTDASMPRRRIRPDACAISPMRAPMSKTSTLLRRRATGRPPLPTCAGPPMGDCRRRHSGSWRIVTVTQTSRDVPPPVSTATGDCATRRLRRWAAFDISGAPQFALSPDARADRAWSWRTRRGVARLWVRALDSTNGRTV